MQPHQPRVAGRGQTPTADTFAGLYLPLLFKFSSQSVISPAFFMSFHPLYWSLPRSSLASHQNGEQMCHGTRASLFTKQFRLVQV